MNSPLKIIAESAFNHNGNFNYLKELSVTAKKSGADYFTVQVMNVDAFCVKEYEKYTLYKNTEFSSAQWIELFDFCKQNNINVIPCTLEEASFKLCYNYGFRFIKIHATDITNEPFLKLISKYDDVKVILETQCATLFEINFAIEILGTDRIEALFSGFSNYPTEVEDLNLNVLDFFKSKFNFKLGYADHSLDIANIPLMLLAKGCSYIEKHITLSRNNRNFDYQVSLYPHEFGAMVSTIRHYELALGNGIKHPTQNEHKFRNIMYKKVVSGNTLKRADKGSYLIENEIQKFDKNKVVVALIARLKSKRLKEKVLKPFHTNELIVDLYNKLSLSKKFKTILATSDLIEDKALVDLFEKKGFHIYTGDAISVIDRMLHLAYKEKASAIFRVTGDNPFTDVELMNEMVDLLNQNNLDYVKVNNIHFGVGAELFSTKYLWQLYLKLETTEFSEYLTWYVLNDPDVKMGSIDLVIENNLGLVNLSVDLQEDYDRCVSLLKKINKSDFSQISLSDIYTNIKELEKVDETKEIKLPLGCTIKLKDYLQQFNDKKYVIRKPFIIK
ncbi:MAG: N-acetylneuraminate synthase family protein [Flavobacteriales bacterium]|nr:N-acetylneuraminate synthase family protein [Flavobacteriales bacterium]